MKPPASLFSFAWKTARRSLDPSGRASRSEVAHYVIAALLITFPVSLLTRIAMPYPVHHLVGNALDALLIMPVPALLARRCHDHGRSGHWAWLAVLALALLVLLFVQALHFANDPPCAVALDEGLALQ